MGHEMLAEQAALADQKKKSACLTRNEIRIAAPIALIEGGDSGSIGKRKT